MEYLPWETHTDAASTDLTACDISCSGNIQSGGDSTQICRVEVELVAEALYDNLGRFAVVSQAIHRHARDVRRRRLGIKRQLWKMERHESGK